MSGLVESGGHRYCVMQGSRLCEALAKTAADDVDLLGKAAFDRYASPFETKWALGSKWSRPSYLFGMMELLSDMASAMFGVELRPDRTRHYAGVFRHDEGDYLAVHVDAGLHPLVGGARKHVTALFYLTGGAPLELWEGDSCVVPEPCLYHLAARLEAEPGNLVMFENNDRAWHGVPAQPAGPPRLVATVSFLSDEVEAFANRRERAFFVPRPGEHWDVESYRLRDLRADPERYAEAYRT